MWTGAFLCELHKEVTEMPVVSCYGTWRSTGQCRCSQQFINTMRLVQWTITYSVYCSHKKLLCIVLNVSFLDVWLHVPLFVGVFVCLSPTLIDTDRSLAGLLAIVLLGYTPAVIASQFCTLGIRCPCDGVLSIRTDETIWYTILLLSNKRLVVKIERAAQWRRLSTSIKCHGLGKMWEIKDVTIGKQWKMIL